MTSSRSPRGSGDQASAWLATVFTLVGGFFACTFVVVTSGETPGKSLWIVLGVITLLLLTLWLLREKPPEAQQRTLKIWYWWKKEEADAFEYKPRIRKRSSQTDYGQNEPPTLESIRETVDDQRTWVPSVRNIKNQTDDSTETPSE